MLKTKALKEDWDLMNKTGNEDDAEISEDEEDEEKMGGEKEEGEESEELE